jgi:hypothetical protein
MMTEKNSINSKALILVAIIVVVGIFASTPYNSNNSWAVEEDNASNYTREGSNYVWKAPLQESTKDIQMMSFQTINGNIEILPQKDNRQEVNVEGTIKISKRFLARESTVLEAKKQTRIHIVREKDQLTFKVEQPKYNMFKSVSITVNLAVRVPQGIKINGKTVNGMISVKDIQSAITMDSVNGKVKAEHCEGPVHANTVNGTAEIIDVKQAFEIGTVNGSAHVKLLQTPQDHCKASTVNGSVHITLPLNVGFDVEMSTVNGKAQIDNHTFEGEQKKKFIKGRLNGGGHKITMNAVNGSVQIH